MTEPKFKIGQVVRIISGSPNMTIQEVNYEPVNPYDPEGEQQFTGFYLCTWYETKDLQPSKEFHENVLELVVDTN